MIDEIIKQLYKLEEQKNANDFYTLLNNTLRNRYGLKEHIKDSLYFSINDLSIIVGNDYLRNLKFNVGIKKDGYKIGFTDKDIICNLSLSDMFKFLDKRLGVVNAG